MTSDTQKITFGTFLAQGAAGNMIVIYLLFIAVVVYFQNVYSFLLLLLLPFYLIGMGIIGAVMGTVIWVAGRLLESRPGIILRAAIGIVFPALLITLVALLFGFILKRELLIGAIASGLFYGLPAALLAGSQFNPLQGIIFGSGDRTRRDLGSRFALLAALPLRVASVFGLMESLLCLACLASLAPGTNHGSENLIAASLTVYFTVSVFVSCAPPRKLFLLVASTLVNTPLAICTLNPHLVTTENTQVMAIMAWILISFWILFVVGQMVASDHKHSTGFPRPRILPLTFCEIEIRQALNRW